MPNYQFKAIDVGGKVVFGASGAQSQENLAVILQGQGLFLMECSEMTSGPGADPTLAISIVAPMPEPRRFVFRRGVPLKEVSLFTSQLAIMVRTALPILEALDLVIAQTTTPSFHNLLLEVRNAVSHGEPLSTAFARHPKVFDDVYISLLSAGEASGNLDVMLERLAAYQDFIVKLKQKIQSALVYPLIVILTACAVIAFMVGFVLPTFAEIFAQLNIVLPLPTRILLALGDALRRTWLFLIAGAIAGWIFFRIWRRAPANARIVDAVLLRLPIVGPLIRNIVLTRVLRTMASMLSSGVSILKTLELARASSSNILFREHFDNVSRDVRDGQPLSRAMAKGGIIPKVVIGMISTGERTGTLPEVIDRISEFYESETDTSIKDLFTALEPIFIVGLGVMVAGIAISVLLPMFDMARGIQ